MSATRYTARVEGLEAPRALEIEDDGGARYRVRLDGVEHLLDARRLEHGAVSLIVDGRSYGVEFEERGDEVAVLVRDQVIAIDIADERRLRMRAASGRFTVEGRQTVAAPMPGRVVKVLVAPGAAVTAGQPLVVVEAMKMENELKSPGAGRVLEVRVREGENVEGGAALVVVE